MNRQGRHTELIVDAGRYSVEHLSSPGSTALNTDDVVWIGKYVRYWKMTNDLKGVERVSGMDHSRRRSSAVFGM